MRELILKMSVSLDGFVGGPNGELDWIFRTADEDAKRWTVETLWQAGLHLMGSRTFYDMAAWWPTSTEVFAPVMNQIPKAVATTRGAAELFRSRETTAALKDAAKARSAAHPGSATPPAEVTESWSHPTVLSGDLSSEIIRLKEEPGKEIVAHGGARFARSLVRLGLVDEFRLLIHPVALGTGLPLFSELQNPLRLKLVSATTFPSGAVAHIYRPQRA
jgi:dihydrofolate reductase